MTGAFAAGVLLANTNYRAQIQADILPFKGILLGIFFMGAGSSFNIDLVLTGWPTIITGVIMLIVLKASTLFAATRVPRWMEPNRLPAADAVRTSLLLAGGGGFAFVVLALAEKLGVLPKDLGGLLTAIVLISMGLTPLLGDLAAIASEPLVVKARSVNLDGFVNVEKTMTEIADDAVLVSGYGPVGRRLLSTRGKEVATATEEGELANGLPRIVAFDTDPSLVDTILMPTPGTIALYGEPGNPQVLWASGVTDPAAIFVSYGSHNKVLSTTSRLRSAFPKAPIYARSQTRTQAQSLQAVGANEVVVESDELPRSAAALLKGASLGEAPHILDTMVSREVDLLLDLFDWIDPDHSGFVDADQLINVLRRSNSGVVSDDEIDDEEKWLRSVVQAPMPNVCSSTGIHQTCPGRCMCPLNVHVFSRSLNTPM